MNIPNKFKHFFYLLLACVALAACSGKDGDPGPQGNSGSQGDKGNTGNTGKGAAIKLGFLDGTVSGKRKDGTAFSENFKYEYSFDSVQTFVDYGGGLKYLHITRYLNTQDNTSLTLELWDQEGVISVVSNSVHFKFLKELDADNLFVVEAEPFLEATPAFVREIDYDQNNKTYHFLYRGEWIDYDEASFNGTAAYAMSAYMSNKVLIVYYNKATGVLLGLDDVSGGNQTTQLTSGTLFDLYNRLTFKQNVTLGQPVFYDATTGVSLFEQVPFTPADQVNITNYTRNTTTGVVTFDYEIKISGGFPTHNNSTGHDLTIKGKFNSGGKVYKNMIGRVRS
jgi:hypothetical protein